MKRWLHARRRERTTMKNKVRPIDANALARKIREYMEDFPNAGTRLAACRAVLSMLGDEGQTPTLDYLPAHIDREAWMAEWVYPENEWNLPRCSKCGCNSKDATYGHKDNFCPKCGRAMTPEAWAELEKRLRG